MEHKKHTIDDQSIERFSDTLKMLERSETTISKYIRDVRAFRNWLGEDGTFDKERVMQYKDHLQKEYRINSTNSMISALNTFFKHMEWEDCRVSTLKVQRSSFRSAERHLSNDEFGRLLAAAGKMGNEQLVHIMETIAATGIRIGELPYITVESLRTRRVVVTLKHKTLREHFCHQERKPPGQKQHPAYDEISGKGSGRSCQQSISPQPASPVCSQLL